MAGIGFRLQKLIDHGSYSYGLRGFLFATFLVAGPWITTIVVIALFSHFSTLSGLNYHIFRTTIIYFYAFSLILTGLYQMPLTRYLADELFAERIKSIVPAYLGMIVAVVSIQGVFGLIYSSFIPLSVLYKLLFVAGTVTVSLLWLAGIFLSCLRDFEYIGWAYIMGGLVSLASGIYIEPYLGMEGALAGFIIGQLLTWLVISIRILRELGRGIMMPSFEALSSLGHYKLHLFVGLFFNIAIWIDKFIFWFSDIGQKAVDGLCYYQNYDVPIFIAYVCVIPGLGVFLTRVETDFYLAYRGFYGSILEKKPLKMIIDKMQEIVRTINYTSWNLIKVQGAITLVIVIFTSEFLKIIHYPKEFETVLRWGICASFFQVLFLVWSLMLLYFELRKEALFCNIIFLLVNGSVTYIAVHLRAEWAFGAGYFFSAMLAALTSKVLLDKRLKRLIYITFMTQPMPTELTVPSEVERNSRGYTAFVKE